MLAQSHSHLLSAKLSPKHPCDPTPPKFQPQELSWKLAPSGAKYCVYSTFLTS